MIATFGLFILALAEISGLTTPAQAADLAKTPPVRVIVVGGGLAGLITAHELQNQGITTQVLEASDRWGGRVATTEYEKGLHAEYGMHEIWASNPLHEYAKKFKLALSEPEEPYSSVVIDGKYYPYVQDKSEAFLATIFSEAERKAYFSWLKDAESLYDELQAKGVTPRLMNLQSISLAKWIQAYNLTDKVSEFIRLSLECEMAVDWKEASALYGLMEASIFMHGSEKCYHLKDGNRKIIDALVGSLKGPKSLGSRVTRIVRTQGANGQTHVTVYYLKDSVVHTAEAEKVVVAVPYYLLHAIQMEPTLNEQQWKAVDTLKSGAYTVVHFIIDTAVAKTLLVDDKVPFPVLTRGPLGVVYGFLEKPQAGQKKMIFSLLIHGEEARTYLEPQDKIRDRVLAELDKTWPGFSKHVLATYFYGYHPAATANWPPGRSPFDALQLSLREENKGLFLAGDYLYSSHAEGAVISGREAAKKVAARLK
ncbi:NAD(P)/FAD-dependent oxidoreductase [Bdellovibrionota bacterium FG-1]